MAFWDLFNLGNSAKPSKLAGLPEKLADMLPELDDQAKAKITAIAGLLACVAHSDFHPSEAEQSEIEKSLLTWCKLSVEQAKAVAELAVKEVGALASLEVTTYTNSLDKLLNDSERVEVLEALFDIAASDHEVSHDEAEFIRHISHGLRLSHHEFVAARATVLKHIAMLKKD